MGERVLCAFGVGSVHELVELARRCLGEQAQGVERVRFERGGREWDRGCVRWRWWIC